MKKQQVSDDLIICPQEGGKSGLGLPVVQIAAGIGTDGMVKSGLGRGAVCGEPREPETGLLRGWIFR